MFVCVRACYTYTPSPTNPHTQANGEEENDLWIVSTPNPYEWAFGDTVTYELESPTVEIDASKVTWRIVNGACVHICMCIYLSI